MFMNIVGWAYTYEDNKSITAGWVWSKTANCYYDSVFAPFTIKVLKWSTMKKKKKNKKEEKKKKKEEEEMKKKKKKARPEEDEL